jgi:hypothetical protein
MGFSSSGIDQTSYAPRVISSTMTMPKIVNSVLPIAYGMP